MIGTKANLPGRAGSGTAFRRRTPTSSPCGFASSLRYPPSESAELTRVSQYVAVMRGEGPLHDELHDLLDADYAPGSVHRLDGGASGPPARPRRPVPAHRHGELRRGPRAGLPRGRRGARRRLLRGVGPGPGEVLAPRPQTAPRRSWRCRTRTRPRGARAARRSPQAPRAGRPLARAASTRASS